MKRHPLLGLFTMFVAVMPFLFVILFVVGRGASFAHWFVVLRLILGTVLFVGGILLIVAPRYGYIVAMAAWGLLVADAIWGVIVLWPIEDHWPGSALNLVYLASGAPVLAFLIVSARRSGFKVKRGGIAV